MLRIPIYAYILCNVFDNGALIEELDTTTKLPYIATILVFLREHMRNFHESNVPFINMCKYETRKRLDKVNYQDFAYISLLENRIIFEPK